MKLIAKLSTLTTVIFFSTAGMAQTPPCPTLASLGITQLESSNSSIPMWQPNKPECDYVPQGESCYVTWNLGQAKDFGYSFNIQTAGLNPTAALGVINHSNIFYIVPTGDPGPTGDGCTITSGNMLVRMWALSNKNGMSKAVKELSPN